MKVAPQSKMYTLPTEISVAMTTGRTEMMTAFVKAIGRGERTLSTEEIWSVTDLLKDLLDDKIALQEKLDDMELELLSLKAKISKARLTLSGGELKDTDL